MTERMIDVDGVQLCTEPFGTAGDPAVLLLMGLGGSMLWWDDDFCQMLADGGRFVIRYDQRDTGRSVTYPPGEPGYTGADLRTDALGVLDSYGISSAHVVGVSAGGVLAQLLTLDFPGRVRSLVIISSTPATPGDRDLPGPTDAFGRFVGSAVVDWSSDTSVVDHQVGYSRMLAGDQRPFDEDAQRALVERDVARANDFGAIQNHDAIPEDEATHPPLSAIAVPTLVIHGTADPMFPLAHGEALAAEICDARFLPLEGAGHGVERADFPTIVAAIVGLTDKSDTTSSARP